MEKIMRLLMGLIFALYALILAEVDYNTGSNVLSQHSPVMWLLIASCIHIAIIVINMLLTLVAYRIKYTFWTGLNKTLLEGMNMWWYLFVPFINITNLIYIIFKIIRFINEDIKRHERFEQSRSSSSTKPSSSDSET